MCLFDNVFDSAFRIGFLEEKKKEKKEKAIENNFKQNILIKHLHLFSTKKVRSITGYICEGLDLINLIVCLIQIYNFTLGFSRT